MVENKNNESPATEAKADKLRSFCDTARRINSKATEKLNLFSKNKKVMFSLTAALVLFFVGMATYFVKTCSLPLSVDSAKLFTIDHNFYYGTRTFIGSILTLLTPQISTVGIFIMNVCAYVLLVLIFFYVGKGMLSKAIAQNSSTLFILTLFLVACPYALLQYAGWVGLYDEWICIAAVIGCVAATNKVGCWFVPLICTIAIFTHYEFVFLYLPAILSLLVYLYFSKGKKIGSLVSGLLTFITSFISAVYCGFIAPGNLKMNREQFYGYVASRLGQSSVSTVPYIDSYYFNERSNLEMFIDFAKGGMEEFALEHLLIYAMPFLLVFVAIWVGCIVLSHDWKQRFCYTLCLMTMAVNLAIFVILPDATRWMTATVLSQLLMIFIRIKQNDETLLRVLTDKPWKLKIGILLIAWGVFSSFRFMPQLHYQGYLNR